MNNNDRSNKQQNKIQINTNKFIERAIKIHGEYDYSLINYINNTTNVVIICPIHGEFKQSPKSHLRGSKCKYCAGRAKLNTATFLKRAMKTHGHEYKYIDDNIDSVGQNISIVCSKHGIFKQNVRNHLRGQRCPKCVGNKRLTDQEFTQAASYIHHGYYDYSITNYKSTMDKVEIICPKHGKFSQTPNAHISRSEGCPHCSRLISKPHQTIIDKLDLLDITYQVNDRQRLNGYELDILVGNIGIEINGLWWHGIRHGMPYDSRKKWKAKHREKKILADNCGISLLQFWDYEVIYKRDLIFSMIEHRLGLSFRISARKCELRLVSNKDAKQFIDDNHLQGHRSASYTYGLYYDNHLQAIASFTFSKYYGTYELIRFATKMNTTVVGGFSKILKHFMTTINCCRIVTFADARYSSGNLYKVNGFKLLKHTKSNYFYFKGRNKIISRYQAQKHKLCNLIDFNPDLTEVDNMLLAGYSQVHDAGNYLLELST